MNVENFTYGCLVGFILAGVIVEQGEKRAKSPIGAIRVGMLVSAAVSLFVGIYSG